MRFSDIKVLRILELRLSGVSSEGGLANPCEAGMRSE